MSKLKGEVSTSNVPCIEVTWKLPISSKASRIIGYAVESPPFSFAEASWNLVLLPNGVEKYPDIIIIYLWRSDSSVSEHSVIVRMGFKTDRGEIYRSASSEGFVNENWSRVVQRHPKTSLGDEGDFLYSKETVTVFCQLRLKTQTREMLLELPVITERSLDTSLGNQNITGRREATHSDSPQPVFLNSNTQVNEIRPNSQENLGSSLSERQDFKLQITPFNVFCIEVKWKIPHFTQISREEGYELRSPPFSAAQAIWSICIEPNGVESYPNGMLIGLQRLESSVSDHSATARICFKTDRGVEYRSVCTEGLVNKYCDLLCLRYEKRSHVEACDFLFSEGCVTVFCHLRLISQHCEALLELPLRPDRSLEISSRNDVFAGNSGATQSACSQIELLNSDAHTTDEPQPNSQAIQNMQSDNKKLQESEKEADVRPKVPEEEYRDHECIIEAQTPVFSGKFKWSSKKWTRNPS